MSSTLLQIPIKTIRHRPDARHRSDKALTELSESIEKNGLINPITVRALGDGYEVIAGSHRLQACELLGHNEIACTVVEVDDLHAELMAIDENLRRTELSQADKASQTARREAIYLKLHPETAEHIAGGVAKNAAANFAAAPSFAAATASETGSAERTVRLNAERGKKIVPEALDAVRGTPLDRGVYLDRLKRVETAQQVATVRRDLEQPRQGGVSGQYVRTSSALPPTAAPPPDNGKLFARFIEIADEIEAMPAAALIDGAGRQRAVLGQRASGLADRMASIMEGLDR